MKTLKTMFEKLRKYYRESVLLKINTFLINFTLSLKRLFSRNNGTKDVFRLKIVVSTIRFGGIGGSERSIKSLVESMPDVFFHIYSREIFLNGFIPAGTNYEVNVPLKDIEYDAYLHYAIGDNNRFLHLAEKYDFRKRIIQTTGSCVREIEEHFDHIFIEAKEGCGAFDNKDKALISISNVRNNIPDVTEKVAGLPDRYLLTVFNPWGKVKGADMLYKVAGANKLPIVWAYDNTTFPYIYGNYMPDLPNVIQFKNLNQKRLYYLYERAAAYLSLSYHEAFSFSMADAIIFDLPIISRNTGVLTLLENKEGLYLYNDTESLKKHITKTSFVKPAYNKDLFDRISHDIRINEILREK